MTKQATRIGALAIVALTACGGGQPAPAPVANVNPVAKPTEMRFVVANFDSDGETPRTRVRFAKTAATGIVVTRTVYVPGSISAIAWLGEEPVVMLDDAEVGHITAAGYARFPIVPDDKWIVPKPSNGSQYEPTDRFDHPRWRMLVGSAGDVWQARCDWGWDLPHGIAHHCVPEGGRCDAWVYAHVSPGPLSITHAEPAFAFDSEAPRTLGAAPVAEPSRSIHAEIAPVDERPVLKCTAGNATIQYPTDDDRDLRDSAGDGVSELTWLSTTPPMFSVTRRVGCLDTMSVVFEGCTQSEQYAAVRVGGTGDDVLVLWHEGGELKLRQHDRDLGALDEVTLLAFAPR